MYTNIPGAKRTHLSDILIICPSFWPSHTNPLSEHQDCARLWTNEAAVALQAVWGHKVGTLWPLRHWAPHLSSAVMYYSNFSTDTVTVKNNIKMCPNQKPSFNNSVRKLLKVRAAAIESGDSEAHGKSRADLKRLIKDAALVLCRRHTNAMGMISGTTTTLLCGKGIRITTVLRPPLIPPSWTNWTHSLPTSRTTQRTTMHSTPQRNSHPPFISIRSGRFCRTTLGRQLDLMVFQARYWKHVPTSKPQFLPAWKLQPSSVPKISAVTSLNDYWPIALIAVVMKCFESLVLTNIKTCISRSLD